MMNNTVITEKNAAAVVENSLMAFAAGMSLQNRMDVMNAYQYASYLANRKYGGEVQTEQWYQENLRVMQSLGWLTLHRTYQRERSNSQSLTLGAIAFKSMKVVGEAVFGGPVAEAFGKIAESAIEGLGKFTEAQEVFKHKFKEQQVGTVGLTACLEREDGQVVMVQSAVSTSGMSRALDTIAFEWKNSDTYSYSGTASLIFNTQHYARVRDIVQQRLGDRLLENVLEFDL